jgi:serine/threonine-protein kinase
MDRERWRQIDRIFASALERPATERAAVLDDQCAGDGELRAEVEALLAAHARDDEFLERPASADGARLVVEEPANALLGQAIGRYSATKRLAAGGMGEVFLAHDTHLNRPVALKVLSARLAADEERVRRFRREALSASALNHPNIITIHEIGQWQGRDFIATEFVDGVTLRTHMCERRLTLAASIDIALQIAGALAAAHGAGLVHRDIKPENVMVRPDGLVKVLDFGIAKYANAEGGSPEPGVDTATGVVIGTAAYMSPEQARGHQVDARTDLWSLGVVLYELVARRLPFPGETPADRVASILEREPEPLGSLERGIPPELETIVGRALAKDRNERYSRAADMADDLRRVRALLSEERPSRPDLITSARRLFVSPGGLVLAMAMLALAVAAGLSSFRSGAGAGALPSPRPSGPAIASLAVLPLINVDSGADTEYLADGLTESLITNLSRLPDLKVMSRHSVFRYKGAKVDVRAVGDALRVQAVLVGRVIPRGEDLSISVELLNARNGSHIWGEQYSRKPADLLAVQSEISQKIVARLRPRLTTGEQRQLARRETVNPQAYELMLRGRFYWNKGSTDSRKRAVEYFQHAIVVDPAYALAYTELAKAYSAFGYRGIVDPREAMPRARAAALRALAIDDSLAEAHAWLAYIKQCDWDAPGAEREFDLARQLNPNYAEARGLYAFYLSQMQRHEQAIAEAKRARELDPLSPSVNISYFYTLSSARQYDRAIDHLGQMLELDQNVPLTHLLFGYVYAARKQYQEAIAAYKEAMKLGIDNPSVRIHLGHAYARAGRRARAQAILGELQQTTEYVSPTERAILHAGLGDSEQALRSLEQAYAAHDLQLIYLGIHPHFDPLRSDPRFQDLMRRVGLPH